MCFAIFPNTIPTVTKSASENVVFANPKFPNTGNKITGRNVNNRNQLVRWRQGNNAANLSI